MKNLIRRMRLWFAYRFMMNQGMVMVNAADWHAIMQASTEFAIYMMHGKCKHKRSAAKLKPIAARLIVNEQRFVHPASKNVMKPSPEITKRVEEQREADDGNDKD